jgi:PAS domain S-box-containing protein
MKRNTKRRDRIEEMLDSIQDLIYETDEHGTIVYSNKKFAEVFGFEDPSECPRYNIREFYVDPGHRKLFEAELKRRCGQVNDYRIAMKHSTGKTMYHSVDVTRAEDSEGDIRFRGTERDVSSSLEMLSPVFQCNDTGLITFCNKRFAKLLGRCSESEIIGRIKMQQLFSDPTCWRKLRGRLASGAEGIAESKALLQKADGAYVDGKISIAPIMGVSGDIAGITGSIEDISAEEALRQQFSTLWEESWDGIYLIQDGELKSVNPGMSEILGYVPSELIGKEFEDLVHPDDYKLLKQSFRTKQASKLIQSVRLRIRHKSSEYIYVQCDGTPAVHKGHPAILGYLRDISADMSRQEELESLVREKTREKDELLELLIHELDAPIVGIRGTAETMKRRLRSGFDRLDFQRKIRNIYDLSELSLMMVEGVGIAQDGGELVVERSEVNLRYDVMEATMNFIKPLARNRGFDTERIRYLGGDTLPAMYLDKRLMQQVLFNLLRNSIKYAYRDPHLFDIRIKAQLCAHDFVIVIQDYGIGIPAADVEAIFEKGVRGENTGSRTGKGLGLYAVMRILNALASDVRVTNLQMPTEFTIRLPLTVAHIPRRSR